MSIGIYKIVSPSNKVYVGKSKNIEKRFKGYKILSYSKPQKHLNNSFKKYGWESHKFKIIEECLEKNLNVREKYWIKKLGCFKEGLNLTCGGEGVKLNKLSKELKRINTMKPLIQYDLKGNFIKKYLGAPEFIKEIGKGNSNNINDCARGIYKSTYGYQWKYEDKNSNYIKISPYKRLNTGIKWTPERRIKTLNSRKGEKRSKEYCEKISKLKKKKIYQYNINNKITNVFPSFMFFNKSGIIGTKKLRSIINKNLYYKGFRYSYSNNEK